MMFAFTSLPERISVIVRLAVPCFFMVLLFLLNISAVTLPVIGPVKASLFLMAIYYWAIYRPTLVPLWLLFFAGLLMDLLSAGPLGVNALIFVLAQWIIFGQRRFLMGQSFLVLWFGFGLVVVVSLCLQWAVLGLTQLTWPSLDFVWGSTFFSVSLFPLICIILHLTHKILPSPRAPRSFSAQG